MKKQRVSKEIIHEIFAEHGSVGGQRTLLKHGTAHFSEAGKKGAEALKKKRAQTKTQK